MDLYTLYIYLRPASSYIIINREDELWSALALAEWPSLALILQTMKASSKEKDARSKLTSKQFCRKRYEAAYLTKRNRNTDSLVEQYRLSVLFKHSFIQIEVSLCTPNV